METGTLIETMETTTLRTLLEATVRGIREKSGAPRREQHPGAEEDGDREEIHLKMGGDRQPAEEDGET